MIRTLLTTTAVAALLATGAIAQNAAPTTETPAAHSGDLLTQGFQMDAGDGLASRLLGFPVYVSAAADAERIGEINDLVIDEQGNVAAVILGVGGFLGMGEKNVAVDYGQLQWTMAADNTDRLVLETTREALNAAPGVELIDRDAERTAAVPTQPAAGAMPAEDPVETGSVDSAATPAPTAPSTFDRGALSDFDETTLTAEDLIGTDVYGPGDEHVGTIGDFVLAEDGQGIDAIIIDVGGFLGIGAKEVAVGFENLDFAADSANNRYLLLNVTKEQLESQAAFNAETYASERDTQRLMVGAS